MSIARFRHTLVALIGLGSILLATGCYPRRPHQGVILIDTDLPTRETPPLEVGFSLDEGSAKGEGGRNLLTGRLHTVGQGVAQDSLQRRQASEAAKRDSLRFPQVHQMSRALLEQLIELQPSFIRYPAARGGRRYTIPAKPLRAKPTPLSQEKAEEQSFGVEQLLALAHLLQSEPILVTTLGYDQKLETFSAFLQELNAPQLILQPEYGTEGLPYFYRFTALEQQLERDSVPYQLIASGRLTPHRKYSDFVYDWALPPLTDPKLQKLDTLLAGYNPLVEPLMISEVAFDDHPQEGRFIPPLALRAAFLITAEAHALQLRSIGITPLVGESLEQDFPLLLLDQEGYHRTQWFQLLQLFRRERGTQQVPLPEENSLQRDLLINITKEETKATYYIKVVNMTRHPIQYQIRIKGSHALTHHIEYTSFTPKAKSTTQDLADFLTYRVNTYQKELRKRKLAYYFQPFEITLIKLTL